MSARQGFGGLIERGPMAADVIGAHYTTVFNQAVRDRRISRRARGLLVELLSHRDGYGISMAMLITNGPEGKDALTAALRELEDHDYLHRVRERDARGRLGETRYYLTDMPAGAELIAQAPWTAPRPATNPAPGRPAASGSSRRSGPKSGNPPLDEYQQTPWSEPKAGFPAQAQPAQENPPHKKNNFKKTNQQNTNPLRPSAPSGVDRPTAQQTAVGESVLLSIARHHPELHAALATGTTLADQAPRAAQLIAAGVSREHIREALVGRPYPPPAERTHSLAALVAARLQQLQLLAAATEHTRTNWPQPAATDEAQAAPHPVLDIAVPPKPECGGLDGMCGRPVPAPGDLCRQCG